MAEYEVARRKVARRKVARGLGRRLRKTAVTSTAAGKAFCTACSGQRWRVSSGTGLARESAGPSVHVKLHLVHISLSSCAGLCMFRDRSTTKDERGLRCAERATSRCDDRCGMWCTCVARFEVRASHAPVLPPVPAVLGAF